MQFSIHAKCLLSTPKFDIEKPNTTNKCKLAMSMNRVQTEIGNSEQFFGESLNILLVERSRKTALVSLKEGIVLDTVRTSPPFKVQTKIFLRK